MTILDEILEFKREEVERAVAETPRDEMRRRAEAVATPTRGFRHALDAGDAPAVIAEVKHRSPSKGIIRADFNPLSCACAYAEGGAAALSVLTDEHFFGGQLGYLALVREAVALPLLRKDFVLDGYQIDEARAAGADAILLIVSTLTPEKLDDFQTQAAAYGLDVLVEVHDEAELDVALAVGASLVGVNNRDLRTFDVDLGTTERLAARLPPGGDVLLVAESGIVSNDDVLRLEKAGARAFLVGESLMREADMSLALRRLRRPQ